MMATLIKVRNLGVKIPIEFRVFHTVLDGLNSSQFKSYIAFLGRRKVSILLDDWKDVSDEVKNSIWTDVQLAFEFSDDLKLKISG
ncbi:unnamed protein product [Lathyrus oleraceus]